MHEMSVAQNLLELLEEEARKQGAHRVTRLRVRIGELSGVEPELLRTAFQYLSPGTLAEGAVLELRIEPLEGQCQACGRVFRIENFTFLCPSCGSPAVRVIRGEGMYLESLEMEVEDARSSGDSGSQEHSIGQ